MGAWHSGCSRATVFVMGKVLGIDLGTTNSCMSVMDGGVSVGSLHNLVGDALGFLADLVELAAYETLDGENGVLGVGHRLTLGCITDQALAVLAERHHRRRRPTALGILEDERLAAVHDRHAGVRRS